MENLINHLYRYNAFVFFAQKMCMRLFDSNDYIIVIVCFNI